MTLDPSAPPGISECWFERASARVLARTEDFKYGKSLSVAQPAKSYHPELLTTSNSGSEFLAGVWILLTGSSERIREIAYTDIYGLYMGIIFPIYFPTENQYV